MCSGRDHWRESEKGHWRACAVDGIIGGRVKGGIGGSVQSQECEEGFEGKMQLR